MKQDTEQFKRKILPLQPSMQRMAESLLHNEDEAADVVQDCFVTLWNDREKLQHIVNHEAWCITLVKRRCADLLRRHNPTIEIDERTMTLAEEEANDADERLQLALKFVERLPGRQKEVISLKYLNGVDTKHIASRLSISESNVYTLLSRAYNSLKQMILEYEKR